MKIHEYVPNITTNKQLPLTLNSMPESDFFNSPTKKKQDGTFKYTKVTKNFSLKATISVELVSLYDAGGLMVYENENRWLKLVVEKTSDNKINIVSMVTNTYSDDVIGESVSGDNLDLKIHYQDGFFDFSYAQKGQSARKHRKGFLNLGNIKKVGFISQSPKGIGTEVKINNIKYKEYY